MGIGDGRSAKNVGVKWLEFVFGRIDVEIGIRRGDNPIIIWAAYTTHDAALNQLAEID